MKKSNLGIKLFITALTLMVIVYFGIGIYRYFEDPLSTTLAYAYQVSEGVDVTGFVVRQESLLPDEDAGVLRLGRAEGEKVGRGGTVATVYADHDSLARQTEVDELENRIAQLSYARDAAMTDEVAVKLDSQVLRSIRTYRADLAANRLRDAENEGASLRTLILKSDYTHADMETLESQIQGLQEELKAKKAQAASSVRRITAPVAGLWSAAVDGYETVLTPQNIFSMTPGELSSLQPDSAVRSSTGKLVLGDKWYYAAILSEEDAARLKKEESRGVSLLLRFTKEAERDLAVSIASVSAAENGRCVVVLEGQTYLQKLTMLRQQRAQIVTGTVEGLRIPKEALRAEKTIRNEDGTTEKVEGIGVYCMVGMEAHFKPVEVVYSGENFVIVRSNAPADKENIRIRVGDKVIVAARGLYDGKVVG